MVAQNFQEHLAALSPYFHIYRQPPAPVSRKITRAVYLFRHGILEVSHYDFNTYINPFLRKLDRLQRAQKPFAQGTLVSLLKYRSWISEAHVGMVSSAGLRQSADLGRHFRIRYGQLLQDTQLNKGDLGSLMSVWTDSATRCRLSGISFAEAFSGRTPWPTPLDDDLPQVDCQVKVSNADDSPGTCNNLSWHTSLRVDQTVGSKQMRQLMGVTTSKAHERLKGDWVDEDTFGPEDVYAMQLLHCYDVVSGRQSAFNDCFTSEDWVAFEYLRDMKYHFSEGYGSDTASYALPWLASVMRLLNSEGPDDLEFPLHVSFTHREEILYLCCLLGIGHEEGWTPNLNRVDESRQWRVSLLAPYLGHVGIETYQDVADSKRMRIIVNGNVMPAFLGRFEQDHDGGYDFDQVASWVSGMPQIWDGFDGF